MTTVISVRELHLGTGVIDEDRAPPHDQEPHVDTFLPTSTHQSIANASRVPLASRSHPAAEGSERDRAASAHESPEPQSWKARIVIDTRLPCPLGFGTP